MSRKNVKKTEHPKYNDERSINLIEAALYVAGRPLYIKTLGSIIGTRSKKRVLKLARNIARDYLNRDGALEIIELTDGRFVLQLKSLYVSKVRRLAMRPLLSTGPLKTLAYIAYRQPVTQSYVVDVRGHHSYSHIKDLEFLGLVVSEKLGRTKILRTTQLFADYFKRSQKHKMMKRQLEALFNNVGEFHEPNKKP